MRHLQKKCLNAIKGGQEIVDVFNTVPVDETAIAQLKQTNYDGYYGMLLTNTGEMIQTFKYQRNKKVFFIPEPNPIVIYFSIAQQYIKHLTNAKADLLLSVDTKSQDVGHSINKVYHFVATTSICATFLFNAIEAFINLLIPEDYIYVRQGPKSTEHFTKEQIQRNLSFEEKVKQVIPSVTDKSFVAQYGHIYERVNKLKLLRDEITHTKTDVASKPNWYEKLYTELLNFDFEKALHASRDYINFYQPDLIEECRCGKPDE